MEIEKILTPSGIVALKYFVDKNEYHFATIQKVTDNTNKSYPSIRIALRNLAKAAVLRECPTGKMILYLRNPNSNFLTAFKAMIEMVENNGNANGSATESRSVIE